MGVSTLRRLLVPELILVLLSGSSAHWVCQSSCCKVQAVRRITAKMSTGIASVQNQQSIPVYN